ncbi:MAG: hypothetical protein GQ574_03020 [Crocinitomix sp.]|nr:hypothetical protein [Crocinitomix sp.]
MESLKKSKLDKFEESALNDDLKVKGGVASGLTRDVKLTETPWIPAADWFTDGVGAKPPHGVG